MKPTGGPPRGRQASNTDHAGKSGASTSSGSLTAHNAAGGSGAGVAVPEGGGLSGWLDGSGIGAGLLRPGIKGSVLRRKVNNSGVTFLPSAAANGKQTHKEVSSTGAGNAKLSALIPRFLRLSALVAAELGREVRGEEEDVPAANIGSASTPGPNTSGSTTSTQMGTAKMYEAALRPSREWYMLLAGLLTRAVLEGYLTAGWRGAKAVECLLTVGLGIDEEAEKRCRERRKERERRREDRRELREIRRVERERDRREALLIQQHQQQQRASLTPSGAAVDRLREDSTTPVHINTGLAAIIGTHHHHAQDSDSNTSSAGGGGGASRSSSSSGSDSDSDADVDSMSDTDSEDGYEEFREEEDMFFDFEPDEMPRLKEAAKILFPALRWRKDAVGAREREGGRGMGAWAGAGGRSYQQQPAQEYYKKSGAEEEYEKEMRERLRRVSGSFFIFLRVVP